MSVRIVLVGYGRMGRAIDALSTEHDCQVVERLDVHNNRHGEGIDSPSLAAADVAIEFSLADAVATNVTRLAARGIDVVVGTTGWDDRVADVRRAAEAAGIGVVHAANFSLGVNLFAAIVERGAALFAPRDDFGAWIHEAHHAAKRDAPSGTALALEAAMRGAGYAAVIDVASTRAGRMPGAHTIGFDGVFDTITLTHTARDRATFARGALEAARWVRGRRGWFTMRDVLGID
jgi:4-hydroxy-tetrahydrodipicolinate reductase